MCLYLVRFDCLLAANSSVSLFGSINMAARTTSGAQVAGRPKRVEIYARLDEAFVELRGTPRWFSPIQLRPTTSGRPSGTRRRQLGRPRRQHPCPKAGRDATSEGRAVGNKELSEYMEGRAYADAAKWVYGQALKPRQSDGSLLMLTRSAGSISRSRSGVGGRPASVCNPKEVWRLPRTRRRRVPGRDETALVTEVPGAPDAGLVRHAAALRDVASPSRRSPPCTVSSSGSIHSSTATARTGRLLVNLLLVRLGYAPAIVTAR